jgi:hypothetical protein
VPAPLIAAATRKAAEIAARKAAEKATARVTGGKSVAVWVAGGLTAPVFMVLAVSFMVVGGGPEAGATGSCAAGEAVPTSAEIPPSMMNAINTLKADYEAAGTATNVAWSTLAAIDFRENNNDPNRSALSGEIIGTTNPDSGAVTSSKADSLRRAGEHLRAMASSVYGVELTTATGGEDIQKALIAYNRGQSYKVAGRPPSDSPYVMNGYDAAHTDMVFPSIPGETLAGMTDYRMGAFTLFTRLGGAAGNCGLSDDELVRIAQQQLGLRETPDGCNCGEQIQKFLGSSPGELWCADFVSWVYREAGRPFTGGEDGGWRVINVGVMHQWHVANGHWFVAGSAEDPRPGDVISFRNDEHVGMVERLDDAGTPGVPGDDVVHTIEGNTSNMVARRDYRRVGGEITGWGRRAA